MCVWRMFGFMCVEVAVWWYVGMFVVYRELLKLVGFLNPHGEVWCSCK